MKKSVWGPTSLNGESLWPTYRDLGVGLFSVQARWDHIAPTDRPRAPQDPNDPAYQWPPHLEETVNDAHTHGMKVQMLIMGTPPWANGGKGWRWAPTDPRDFGDFATAIARKYPSVRLWMIWGEPNRKHNFKPFTPSKSTERQADQGPAGRPPPLRRAARHRLRRAQGRELRERRDRREHLHRGGPGGHQHLPLDPLHEAARREAPEDGHVRAQPVGLAGPEPERPALAPGARSPSGTCAASPGSSTRNFPGKPLKLFLAEWGVPTGFEDIDLQYFLPDKEASKWIRSALRIARTWKRIYTIGWVHPVDTARNSTGFLDVSGKPKPAIYNSYKSG